MNNKRQKSSTDRLDAIANTGSSAFAAGNRVTRLFDRFASAVTRMAGLTLAFGLAVLNINVDRDGAGLSLS